MSERTRRAFVFKWRGCHYIVTTANMPLGSPRVDTCVTFDAAGHRHEGKVYMLTWASEMNKYGERAGLGVVFARRLKSGCCDACAPFDWTKHYLSEGGKS